MIYFRPDSQLGVLLASFAAVFVVLSSSLAASNTADVKALKTLSKSAPQSSRQIQHTKIHTQLDNPDSFGNRKSQESADDLIARNIVQSVMTRKQLSLTRRAQMLLDMFENNAERTFTLKKPLRFTLPLTSYYQLGMLSGIVDAFLSMESHVNLNDRYKMLELIRLPTSMVVPFFLLCTQHTHIVKEHINFIVEWLTGMPVPSYPTQSPLLENIRNTFNLPASTKPVLTYADLFKDHGLYLKLQLFPTWWRYLQMEPKAISRKISDYVLQYQRMKDTTLIEYLAKFMDQGFATLYFEYTDACRGDRVKAVRNPVRNNHVYLESSDGAACMRPLSWILYKNLPISGEGTKQLFKSAPKRFIQS